MIQLLLYIDKINIRITDNQSSSELFIRIHALLNRQYIHIFKMHFIIKFKMELEKQNFTSMIAFDV